MPRIPRSLCLIPGLSAHKTWRGHNKEFNLGSSDEKSYYLDLLNQELAKQQSVIQAITLMDNHSHEQYFIHDVHEFSCLMRRHHGRYGFFFNQKHQRRGKVAQDRPHTSSIENNDLHEMTVLFYIHANPVRANLTKNAANYKWSTHKLYAFGKKDPWMRNIQFPEWYMKLGKSMSERQKKYRKLFDAYLKERGLIKIRFSEYGYGSWVWILQRKQHVRSAIKNNSHSPP